MRLLMMLSIPKTFPTLSASSTYLLERMAQYKARVVLRALIRKGWVVSQKGSHIKLRHPVGGGYMFGFHDNEELGHAMLSRIAKHTGLTPEDF
jgi:predicted RNA binding protein YcfA (HicA-like mRNA interferase family)